MCLDCGCGEPNDQHGDSRHITMKQVEEAAKASEISVDEAVKNITETMKSARAGSAPTAGE
jgi:hypothetical protein